MRGTSRLLATIKPATFLEKGAPTGLAGIRTHPRPRPTLIYTYNQTLKKLQGIPETSVYRQSVEAVTQSRLSIVQGIKPAGYDQWLCRVKEEVAKHPSAYTDVIQSDGSVAVPQSMETEAEQEDLVESKEVFPEGGLSEEEAKRIEHAIKEARKKEAAVQIAKPGKLEPEPSLDANQINAIETKIGAGLIEEVILVAEGELKLVDEMIDSKVRWEPLEERAAPGQWQYSERNTHTGTT